MFTYSEEKEKKDIENGVSKKKLTEIEISKLMNSLNPDLKFTTETEVDFKNQRLPTLSFELWSERQGLKHSYFEKDMRSQVLTMQRSSMAEQSMFSILVNELVRRFEVMSASLEESEQISIVNHYMKQLRNSGYNNKQAKDNVISAIRGVMRKRERRSNQERRYLTGEETLENRITKKLTEASNW